MILITLEDYFGDYDDHPDARPEVYEAAAELLDKVNRLLEAAAADRVPTLINPKTQTCVSGTENGGFRPQSCTVGAPRSKHKTGHAIDVYDPDGRIDRWLTDERLEEFGLWREHPDDTGGWAHLQDIPPGSGRRTFKP